MLTFQWRRVTRDEPASELTADGRVGGSIVDSNPDLKIRDLMDDVRLRASLVTKSSNDANTVGNLVTALPVRAPGTSMSGALREGLVGRSAA